MLKKANFPHIDFIGLHCHIGSQIVTKAPFISALKRVISFLEQLKKDGIELQYLDIGGGLGIIYKDEKPQTAKDFAAAVLPLLKKTRLKIVMEPGRFIAGNAGILVTKVLYLKDNGVKKFLIVDAGMNDLIRPSLYDAYHEILPVVKTSAKKQTMDVVGPICESGDYFAKDRKLPVLKKGTLLAVMSAGAYGYVMASNYNVRGRGPEVMVKDDRFEIVKEREIFEDLIRNEKIASFL
jgi:diaminopimelate decarboxylase